MVKFSVKGIEEELNRVKEAIKTQLTEQSLRISKLALEDLKQATPIDTGFARKSWELKYVFGKITIENTAPYINALNHGHSKQAPSFFIENTLLRNPQLKPVGTIVTYR